MKITKLIEKLKQVKDEHGDLDVYCWPYDGQGGVFEINESLEPVISPMLGNKKVLFIED